MFNSRFLLTPQYAGTNPQGRSVILDAKCVLGDGRKVNIEVQKSDDTDHQRRVRYNGAILTTNLTDPGEKFENIPDVCVVFISRFDIFNGNRSLYHVERVIRETGNSPSPPAGNAGIKKQRRDIRPCVIL